MPAPRPAARARSPAPGGPPGRAPARRARSLRDERSDDYAAVRLVAFAVGLDAGAVLEVLVDDAPLLGAHLIHLDRAVALQGPLGGAVGAGDEDLAAALAVASGVEDDALALPHPAEGCLVAEQLQGVDSLPALADQQAVVVLAADHDVDAVITLLDLNLTLKVELVEDLLDQLPDPLRRLRRPVPA